MTKSTEDRIGCSVLAAFVILPLVFMVAVGLLTSDEDFVYRNQIVECSHTRSVWPFHDAWYFSISGQGVDITATGRDSLQTFQNLVSKIESLSINQLQPASTR